MDEKKVLNLVHLARKARKVQMGFDTCERACFAGTAKLIIVAEDMAVKKKTKIKDLAEAYNVKIVEFGSKESFGKEFNTRDLGLICVEDSNFAKGIKKHLDTAELDSKSKKK